MIALSRHLYRTGIITLFILITLTCGLAGKARAGEVTEDLIIVNKKTNKMAFFRAGILEKEFAVGTGRTNGLTPEGKFKIVNKIKNRPYYTEKIPGGDPKNPLGDRWLGLEVNGTYGTTYAIHGNNNPKSIGKYVSSGCIRMKNEEIHWLYEQVKINTYVVITSSKLSFDEIAAEQQYPLMKTFKGKLTIDGETKEIEKHFILYQDKILVPLRSCFELLGGVVIWDHETKTATATVGDKKIVHQAAAKKAEVNGESLDMTVHSRNLNGTLIIPLRDIAQMSGYSVQWDAAAKTIIMESPVKQS